MKAAAAALNAATVRAWWVAGEWHRLVPVVREWAVESIPHSFGLSADEADDVVSRATIRVWTSPVVPDEPRAWVRVVVLNAIRDRTKSRWVKGRVADVPFDEMPGRETADAWIEESAQRQRVGRLREALRRLPEPLRRCLVLHDLHGRTCGDIGRQLEITEGACKMRLTRARRLLARLYATTPDVELDATGWPRLKRGRAGVRTWRQMPVADRPLVLDPRAPALRLLYGAY